MRARSLAVPALVLASIGLLPTIARADPRLLMAWDDCPLTGSSKKDFACDGNTGDPFELILAVAPPQGLVDFVGFLAVVDFDFESQVTPSWWDLPGCRPTSALLASQASSGLSCPDISEAPFGFASDYAWGMGYPGRARYRLLGFLSADAAIPLVPDEPVALCRVSISRQRTVGPDACAGCATPVCILFKSVFLDSRTVGGGQTINSGYKNFVRFQDTLGCPFVGSPTTPRSWGAIKSLYR